MFIKKIALSTCLTGLLAAPAVMAQTTATGTLGVHINIGGSCTAVTDAMLEFFAHPDLSTAKDGQASFTVNCTNGLPYEIGLDNGQSPLANQRRMKHTPTANYIAYNLYQNAARTVAWGDTLGVDTLSGVGTGAAQSVPVYGRVPAAATPVQGNYQDKVIITAYY